MICHRRPSVFFLVTLTLMTQFCGSAMAAGPGGTLSLNTVDVENGAVYLDAPGMLNPDSCLSSAHAVIPDANTQQKEFLSVALTAMASGKHVILWLSGCSATPWSTSEPVVAAISLAH